MVQRGTAPRTQRNKRTAGFGDAQKFRRVVEFDGFGGFAVESRECALFRVPGRELVDGVEMELFVEWKKRKAARKEENFQAGQRTDYGNEDLGAREVKRWSSEHAGLSHGARDAGGVGTIGVIS